MARTDPDKILNSSQLLALERFLRNERTENRKIIFGSLVAFVSLLSISGGAAFYILSNGFQAMKDSVLSEAKNIAATIAANEINREGGSRERYEAAIIDALQKSGELQAAAKTQSRELDDISAQISNLKKALDQSQNLAPLLKSFTDLQAFVNTAEFRSDIAQRVSPFPASLVIASIAPCSNLPGGWTEFTQAQGRFIIGVGNGVDKNKFSRTFSINDKDGEYRHTLKIEEIPAHNHRISSHQDPDIHDGLGGSQEKYGIDQRFNPAEQHGGFKPLPYVLEMTGGGGAHDIMPPYIALYFCQKA
jgi:hypothetical protein